MPPIQYKPPFKYYFKKIVFYVNLFERLAKYNPVQNESVGDHEQVLL